MQGKEGKEGSYLLLLICSIHGCHLHYSMALRFPLSLSSPPSKPHQNPNLKSSKSFSWLPNPPFRRDLILRAASLCIIPLFPSIPFAFASNSSSSSKTMLLGIANTTSWFQFFGDGFAVRVPPQFEDSTEPEDYSAGLSLYGDKAKPKTFAARFTSSDGLEVLSVLVRPTNQLKITFLEAQDITNFGTLKEAAKIFVPVGAALYTARTIKIKEDENVRTYYFYEFGRDEQHVALVATVNKGKAIVAGASAPQSKWENDGVKLRSAAISLTVI